MIRKKVESILQYKFLTLEIQHMWNVKGKVIPIIIGATGTISKSLKQYLNSKPRKHEIKELQKKKQHIGHCTHILGNVLM